MSQGISHVLTNEAVPRTEATITVRVIKSFEYRTERSLVLHKLNLETTTVGGLKEIVRQAIQTGPTWRPYRNAVLDTLKLYTKAHGAKVQKMLGLGKPLADLRRICSCQTTNLIINLDHDDWILAEDGRILADAGLENETEVSFFSRQAYESFKHNPEVRWDTTLQQ